MANCRGTWRFSTCLLLGLLLLATTLQNVQGEDESEAPSQCRPYIEKALKEQQKEDVILDQGDSDAEPPADDSEHDAEADADDTANTESTETQQDEATDTDTDTADQASVEETEEVEAETETEAEPSIEEAEEPVEIQDEIEDPAESTEDEESHRVRRSLDDATQSAEEEGVTNEETSKNEGESVEETAEEQGTEQSTEAEVEASEEPAGEESEEPAAEGSEEPAAEASHETVEETSQEAEAAEGSQEGEATEASQEDAPEEGTESVTSTEAEDGTETAASTEAEEGTATEEAQSIEAEAEGDTEGDDQSVEAAGESVETSQEGEQASVETTESVEADTEGEGKSAEATEEKSGEAEKSAEAEEEGEKFAEAEESAEAKEQAEEQGDAAAESKEAAGSEEVEVKEGEEIVAEEEAKEAEAEGEQEEVKEVEEEVQETEEEVKEDEGTEQVEESKESVPEEDLMLEIEIPEHLRPRDQIDQLLKLDESNNEPEKITNKINDLTLKELKKLYENAIKPLETLFKYRDLSNRHFGDSEIFSKPLVVFMGPWSGGKSSIVNYLLNNEYNATSLRTGAEPSPAYFNLVMYGDEPEILDGTQLAADFTFAGLQKFGQGLEERLRGLKLPNKLLEKINIVEIPGILEVRKQVSRVFPFNDACQWFIDRADIIFLVYDPSKLDVGPETEAILDQLKGREHQTRIILNKADQVKPEELMRVQSALIWNISPLMSSAQPPVMYTTSLWSRPYEQWAPVRLLQAQERAFLRDLRTAVDKRIENKISSARRFAVRVRNHAKMVDCYLTTYYNHKSVFGNRKQVADQIIEHPQDYHIYEGLSTLTNISRYDLPDPDVYRDFFRLNPLYDFQQLSATCTYFRGCPINRLDIAIAYDLPELVGKHKKLVENAIAQIKPDNS